MEKFVIISSVTPFILFVILGFCDKRAKNFKGKIWSIIRMVFIGGFIAAATFTFIGILFFTSLPDKVLADDLNSSKVENMQIIGLSVFWLIFGLIEFKFPAKNWIQSLDSFRPFW